MFLSKSTLWRGIIPMTMKNIHGWTIPAAKGLRPIENLTEGKEFFLRYLLVEPVEPACPTKIESRLEPTSHAQGTAANQMVDPRRPAPRCGRTKKPWDIHQLNVHSFWHAWWWSDDWSYEQIMSLNATIIFFSSLWLTVCCSASVTPHHGKKKRSGKTGPRCIGQDHGDSAEGHDPETSRQKRYGKYDLNILLYIVFNE